MIAARDEAAVAAQLGRLPRGQLAVAHRCPCGLPDVVETAPRLPDGSPFPTLYYLTCPRATAAVSKLEAAGLMREMTARLAAGEPAGSGPAADEPVGSDPAGRDPAENKLTGNEPAANKTAADRQAGDELRRRYRAAHADYLARRDAAASAAGVEPLPAGTQTAGGMPDRVKCLHALVAHELAVGADAGAAPPGAAAAEVAAQAAAAGVAAHAPDAGEKTTGVNPFGREALDAIGQWWAEGPCVTVEES